MCGVIASQGNFKINFLKNGLKNILHRGPDYNSYFIDEKSKTFLGHARLSILDLSKNGNQPMHYQNDELIIVFNGEIYNYLDLKEKYLINEKNIKSTTDTEVILFLFKKFHTSFVNYLNGMFCIIIYEKKTKNLYVFRDRFGIKPIYYFNSDYGICFSSEMKGLLEIIKENDNDKINRYSIFNYLKYLWNPTSDTLFKSMKKFLPGHYMVIKDSKIKEYKSWLNFSKKINNKISLKEIKNNVYNKLKKAVESQMIADVPVGCFLSGGLDSSAIAYFASKVNPQIQCYVINIIGDKSVFNDDLKYAKIITKKLNLKLNIIDVDSKSMAKDLEKMIYHLEEPIADPSALYVKYISAVARSHGIKVLLSGVGGDDIFSGYRRHLTINFYEYLKYIPFQLINVFKKFTANNFFILRMRRLNKFFCSYDSDKNQQLINLFTWTDNKILKLLFKNKSNDLFDLDRLKNPFEKYLEQNNFHNDSLSKILSLEQRFFLTEHNLIYNDKMSMSESIEVRVPYLDYELVDFVNSIPNYYKIKKFNTKWILKETMSDYLPKEIIYRKKVGFGAPIRSWIKKDLKYLVNDLLSEKNIKKRDIFEYSAIKKLIKNNDLGIIDASYSILSLMCIEIWLRKFYDNKNKV